MIRRLLQFRDDARAVAAVEFALILPLLLTLYLGTIEAATLYSVDHKVATVASTMADLVSREKGEISTANLDKYFEAAETIMRPYTTTGLVQVVSLLNIDADGVATVAWSAAHGAEEAREADSEYPLAADAKINLLARGASGWLVASEITYPHQSIFGMLLPSTINLAHTQYFLPRYNGEIELD
ncbi:hypothetical protein VW23_015670 [Devosia insulae DS-56]|uniref:TadE-like domain-containing protein n=1 Tax=Devosia insulae DS-56 TaxID=1116389 RepID=A0A1E5XSH3_9HYPH|nr:TadE/TadG family type IV pilus assembly protein [Devosia insulae]OEO31557.1 hypothetical protein VW23_015670 [Devosia insulae DS-56]